MINVEEAFSPAEALGEPMTKVLSSHSLPRSACFERGQPHEPFPVCSAFIIAAASRSHKLREMISKPLVLLNCWLRSPHHLPQFFDSAFYFLVPDSAAGQADEILILLES